MNEIRILVVDDEASARIVATAFGDVSSAVAAMRAGASDYLTKPVDFDALLVAIERARERRALRVEAEILATLEATDLGEIGR